MPSQLAIIRKGQNITQSELGEAVGLSKQAICNIEKGRSNGAVATWDAICHALGVPLSEQHKLREVSLPENTSAEKTAN